MSKNLSLCPFCGCVDVEVTRLLHPKHKSVVCLLCGAGGPVAETGKKASEAWNRRALVDILAWRSLEEPSIKNFSKFQFADYRGFRLVAGPGRWWVYDTMRSPLGLPYCLIESSCGDIKDAKESCVLYVDLRLNSLAEQEHRAKKKRKSK